MKKLAVYLSIFLFIITLSFLLFPEISSAEALELKEIWGNASPLITIVDVAVDSSGVYSAGFTNCPSCIDQTWRLNKYHKDNGDLIWERVINPLNFPSMESSKAMTVDSTGVYAVGFGNNKGRIEKLSLVNGDTIWSQTTSNYYDGKDIALTSSNDAFYVLGFKVFDGNYYWIIEKRNPITGALDNTFGNGGAVLALNTNHIPSRPTSIAIGSDGFYVAGLTDISVDYGKWRIEKRNLTTGALDTNFGTGGVVIYDPHSDGGRMLVDAMIDYSTDLSVGPDGLYAVNGYNAEKWSLSTGELVWRQRLSDYRLYNIDFDTANNLYAVGEKHFDRFIAKLSSSDGSLVWGRGVQEAHIGDVLPNIAVSLAIDPSDQFIYTGGWYFSLPDFGYVSKIEVGDFTLNTVPLRHAVNPNWMRDYSVSIVREGELNDAVTLSAAVAFGEADLQISWPNGNIIAAGESGPKIMRVRALDPPTETKRGRNYDIKITASGGGITKQQEVDFYLNQRPIAKAKVRGNTNISRGQSVRIYDNGSVDLDILAPGNVLIMAIADFNNDAVLDFNGNLSGIDKCFIVGDDGTICNNLWPGSASPNPGGNDWTFQYNTEGAYSIRYFVFDDLIADAQAVDWTERFKSAGMAAEIPVIVGPPPGQPPTAVIEIQNESGWPIDQALPGQLIYAYVGGSSDADGTISQVSFCADTSPENNPARYNCDGDIMGWTFPPFYWNISDLPRDWLAIAKKLRAQLYQPGTYAVYAMVKDNESMVSRLAMDTITIINPPPPVADDQAVSTDEDALAGITLTGSGSDGVTSIVNISDNNFHSLAVRVDGTVWAWGRNEYNQAGDCEGQACYTPHKINGAPGFNSIIKVAAGYEDSIALKSDGTVWVWGDIPSNPTARQISRLSDVVNITSGGINGYSYALTQDGFIYKYFQSLDFLSLLPDLPGIKDIVELGHWLLYVLQSDDTVWRYNGSSWFKVVGLDNAVKVSDSSTYIFALKSDGTVDYIFNSSPPEHGRINGIDQVIDIHSYSYGILNPELFEVIMLRSNGEVWVAYLDHSGRQQGNSTRVNGLTDIVSLGGGWDFHIALKSDGSLLGWGNNEFGQLGDGTNFTPPSGIVVQTLFPLNYLISALPTNGSLKDGNNNPITTVPYQLGTNPNVSYTPNLNYFGSDSFMFQVNDGFSDSSAARVSMTVNPVNDAPTANAGPSHITTVNSSHIHEGALATDVDTNADHDLDSYQWQFTSCPGVSCLTALADVSGTSGTISAGSTIFRISGPTYTPLLAGDYILQLTVRDSAGATAIASVTETAASVPTFTLTVTKSGSGSSIGTVTSDPTGINCGTDCSEAYNSGTSVTLTAAPGTAPNKFIGWSGAGCSGTETCVVTMDAAKTVNAKFYLPTFTLTPSSANKLVGETQQYDGCYDEDGTGTEKSTICSDDTDNNTHPNRNEITWTSSNTAIATINTSGLAAAKAIGAVTISGIYQGITATASLTVSAVPTYTLTVTKSGSGSGTATSTPAGIDCGADCREPYSSGTTVILTAMPAAGSNFQGWSGGGCSGTGTCTVIMDADKTVDAKFNALPAEADIKANDADAITVPYNSIAIIEWCGADAHSCANAATCKVGTLPGNSDISPSDVSSSTTTQLLTTNTTYYIECANRVGDTSYDNVVITVDSLLTQTLTITNPGVSGRIASAGISCGNDGVINGTDCAETHARGTNVTLTATPNSGAGYSAGNWGGDCGAGSNAVACALTMDAAKTVSASFNALPTAINLTAPNWNIAQAGQLGALKANLQWQFSDSDTGAKELAYRLIIDTDQLTPYLLDTGKCLGYNNPDVKCRINLGVDRYPVHEQISLNYHTKYYWWVEVWDNLDLTSGLTQYNTAFDTDNDDDDRLTFTTYSHEMPLVDFSWSPLAPSRGEKVKFSDASKYYTSASPNSPTDCNPGHCIYLWIVPADAIIDNAGAKNPKITFGSSGQMNVTLKVTDEDGYYSSLTKTLNLKQKLPSWREVKPE